MKIVSKLHIASLERSIVNLHDAQRICSIMAQGAASGFKFAASWAVMP